MNKCLLPLAGLLLCLLFPACGPEQSAEAEVAQTDAPPKEQPLVIPPFQRDSAYSYVAQQVAFGPRVMNTTAHENARKWFVEKLESFGAQVREQNFDATAYTGEILKGTNIIARYAPTKQDRILLCAHWDSRHIADSRINTGDKTKPVDGADDGASGVGVLLEVARQLGMQEPGIGVDIVLLDAEDYGETGAEEPSSWGLGAQFYARNLPAGPKPRYGILLDMVGARNARFAKEGVSMRFAPAIVDKVWRLGQQMGYSNYFVDANGNSVTDDHYFINLIANIPTIDIINHPLGSATGFVEHWHTDHDNMDVIDRRTLRAVGQLMLAVIYREAAGKL